MAPKTNSGGMKQATLGFASSKRNASATLAGKANVKPATPATTIIKPKTSRSPSIQSHSSGSTTTEEEEDVLMVSTSAERAPKRQRVSSPKKTVKPTMKLRKRADSSESESESEDLDVFENSPRFIRQFGLARQKMGSVHPVHSEGQTKAFQFLRVFDTSYEYGPCVGVTRLERWERAQMLGLNPPVEVREILTTKQGIEDDMYKHSVFYGEVA
ncbi:hypothetical protein SCHPADRAFT_1001681 [Schizopora paradoxa]|uniref:DNA polymerase delta subunit 4 n=1 Tax=Schizopora paradoxa TaxID=27342 RepID=A0A0H2R7U0_9AGAM|nr:hypothetical protein SCHPADRAFT_1001681 [Schizopora paradoxa]